MILILILSAIMFTLLAVYIHQLVVEFKKGKKDIEELKEKEHKLEEENMDLKRFLFIQLLKYGKRNENTRP